MLSTKESAKILNVNNSRVRQLILSGRLPAKKLGRDWSIDKRDLENLRDRKPGRPKKGTKKSIMSAAEQDLKNRTLMRLKGVESGRVKSVMQIIKNLDYLRSLIDEIEINFRHKRILEKIRIMRKDIIDFVFSDIDNKVAWGQNEYKFYNAYIYVRDRLDLFEDFKPEAKGIMDAISNRRYHL